MRLLKYLIIGLLLLNISVFGQTDSSLVSNSDTTLDANVRPPFTASLDELEQGTQSQNVSGLLQSSRDIYTSVAGYNFSAARFRIRGYNSNNYQVMMNGVTLNNPEGGRAIWAYWGGLNDITRYQNVQTGINASSQTFGGIGGFSNIDARATSIRKGTKISYALANRTYNHRFMVTHSTGMMDNGLAIAVSASGRYSNEGYVAGTFYRGTSYFISLEKKLNEKHSLGLVAYGAPTIQGRRSISREDVYQLTGNNFYNSYWGYQNGEKRNSRVRNNHRPQIMLNHYFKVNDKTTITTSGFYTFGRTGSTRINWFNAVNARPDYYKYLPQYYANPSTQSTADELTAQWQSNDPNVTQINWDQMYFANSKNLFTQTNANGTGSDVTFNRSKYIVEEQRRDISYYGINSNIEHKLNEKLNLSGGIVASKYKSKNFKVINDLLGGDYWVDINQFADRSNLDAGDLAEQNDINNVNRLVKVGDKFGYDYDINIDSYSAFGQVEGTSTKVDWFAGFSVKNTSFWRTGHMQNGLFPETSLGDSEKQNFFNYGVKAGAVYKITGRHLIRLNGAYLTRAPYSRTAFVSPRSRNQVVPNLKNAKILSGDISYLVRYPKVKTRVTGFYTSMKDKTWQRSFYNDEFNNFVNYTMTGVDQLFMGVELGAEVNVTSDLVAIGAFTTGEYIYDSRPVATITQDNSETLLAENKTIYLKNYKIGGMPQTAMSLGLKYFAPKYWFFSLNFNYFTDIYLGVNPDRRTDEVLSKYVSTDPQVANIIDQTKLNDDYVINASVGKSWRIKNKYYVRLNINVNNVLDNTEFQTGGFEQLRYDANNIDKFPPKIGYMYGRTYFAMVSFSF